jgi:hypothetical protein
MLFRDRPLLPSTVDAGLYVSRPALENALLRPLEQGRNVLLLGDPGAGKTTLMRQIASELEERDTPTFWINASLAETAEDLLIMVIEALGVDEPLIDGERRSNVRLLELTRILAARPPAVIIVDNLSDSVPAFDLFGRLRDELWSAGHAWLAAARPNDSGALRSPPAEAFWSTVVEIPPLNEAEVDEFLRRGLSEPERQRLQMVPVSGFQPRLLIRQLQSTMEEGGEGKDMWIQRILEQAAKLGRSEEAALRELIGLGRPASAHDPELQKGLGWSRSYTQRIFSHLEAAHLVRSIPEPTGERAGRPRKLYEPNPSGVS